MEVNRKRNGFMKGKLVMSFYRAAKPTSTVQYSTTSNLKPNLPPRSTASAGFMGNQDRITHQPKQNVAFIISENSHDLYGKYDHNPYTGKYDNPGDESVDAETESYITCVLERFRRE